MQRDRNFVYFNLRLGRSKGTLRQKDVNCSVKDQARLFGGWKQIVAALFNQR